MPSFVGFFPLIFSSLPQLLFLNVRAIRPLENRKRGPLPSSLPYTNLTTSETWSNLPMGISTLKIMIILFSQLNYKSYFFMYFCIESDLIRTCFNVSPFKVSKHTEQDCHSKKLEIRLNIFSQNLVPK
jgi:hypothetical protein